MVLLPDRAVLPLVAWYYRPGRAVPLLALDLLPMLAPTWVLLCFLLVLDVAMTSFCRFRVFVLRVSGGGSRHSKPVRNTESKRYRNPDEPEGSNPPKCNIKKTASKYKETNIDCDTMPLKEFARRRKKNPYVTKRAQFRGGEMFWSKQQS